MGQYGRQREQTGTLPFRQPLRRRRAAPFPLSTIKTNEAVMRPIGACSPGSGDLSVKAANSLDYPDRLEPMTETPQSRAARLAHLRRTELAKGDPVPLPLTLAAMYHLPGDPAGFNQYGRFANPTWDAVERLLGHLEDATAVAFPSGMAAISAVLFSLLKTGDRILLPSDGYYTTRVLADRFLKPMGIVVDTRADVDASSMAASTAIASSSSRARPIPAWTFATSPRSPTRATRQARSSSPTTRP